MKTRCRSSLLQNQGGFSLIEILVTVAIIAVLVALAFPAMAKIKDSATKAKDANNLQQQAKLVFSYAGDHDNTLPGRINRGTAIPSTVTDKSKRVLYLSTVLIDGNYCDSSDAIWKCPVEYGANASGVAYVVNSGNSSVPQYFFGSRSNTVGATKHEPQKIVSIKANIDPSTDPQKGKDQEPLTHIWMITNADADNYGSAATPTNPLGGTVYTPWGGRNYVYFDGHMEFVKKGNYPSIN